MDAVQVIRSQLDCVDAVPFGPGDTNCDGLVSFVDIQPFVAALTDKVSYTGAQPDCHWRQADCDGDGDVDFLDIGPFVELLGGGG
jgi:hypothetical protein